MKTYDKIHLYLNKDPSNQSVENLFKSQDYSNYL